MPELSNPSLYEQIKQNYQEALRVIQEIREAEAQD